MQYHFGNVSDLTPVLPDMSNINNKMGLLVGNVSDWALLK